MMEKYQIYINGSWVEPDRGEWFESINPYTGKPWALIAHGNSSDVDRAVGAALTAFDDSWSIMKPSKRGRLLNAPCRLDRA